MGAEHTCGGTVTVRADSFTKPATNGLAGPDGAGSLARQVYRWDFNVFEFADRAAGRPLYNVTLALLEDQGLLDGWLLDRPKVEAYLTAVEGLYQANPYHNKTHAADVTQTSGIIMCSLVYNDKSVNEMMHASLAFKLAHDNAELNLFERFSEAEFELVRKLVLEMVLSTDMDVHFALLKRFEDALAAAPDVRTWASVEQRSLLFQMLVHLADLANPSRPWPLALTWAEWVVTESIAQGKREAAAGVAVSDMCNASKVCMPAAQLFFIERFMQPTLEVFRAAAPSFYAMALPWLRDTQSRWATFKAAGVKLPRQGYPQLPPLPTDGQQLWTVLACEQQPRPSQFHGCAHHKPPQEQQAQQQAPQHPVAAG